MGGERSVVIVPGATPKQSWAWWSEKNDLVLAAQPSSGKDRRGAERVIEVLDGKRPGAVGHPIHAELAKGKGTFQPVGLGFMVPIELSPDAASMKTFLDGLGLRGIQSDRIPVGAGGGRADERRPGRGASASSGDCSACTTSRRSRRGPSPRCRKAITGFRVVSLDLPKSLDTLLAVAKSMGGPNDPLANNLVDAFKEKTRLDLRKDVLAHLGPKMAFYLSQAKNEVEVPEAADAGGALGGLVGGFDLKAVMAAAVRCPSSPWWPR